MYLDEFHCVVVGNEPAGLWLLKRLAGAMGENGKPLPCAWIRLAGPRAPVPFPTAAAAELGIELGTPWHAELVTRRRNLVWSRAGLQAAFPGLPEDLWEKKPSALAAPRGGGLNAHRKALQKHPELLGFATGLWKALGRTPQLQPEMLLWSALTALEMGTWSPEAALPDTVTIVDGSEWENPLEELKTVSNGALSLKFRDLKPIVARHWVLNTPYGSFRRLSSESDALKKLLTTEEEVGANRALYRLRIEAESRAVPPIVPPLAISFDADSIPDWDTEVWPFFHSPGVNGGTFLDLIASAPPGAPPGAPLEAVLDRFRTGLKGLNRLFPFLPHSIRTLSVPLNVETCSDDESRSAVAQYLEQTAVELYANTSLHTATRHKSLTVLFPSLHCGLPYPLGPLSAARRLASDIIGKPKDKSKSRETQPPVSPT